MRWNSMKATVLCVYNRALYCRTLPMYSMHYEGIFRWLVLKWRPLFSLGIPSSSSVVRSTLRASFSANLLIGSKGLGWAHSRSF